MRLIGLTSVFLAALVGVAEAADDPTAKCDAVLAKDTYVDKTNTQLSLAILNTLDSTRFEEAKKEAKLGATIPVGDVLIPLSGSYEDFKQSRETLNTKYQYTYNSTVSKNIALASTSSAAIQAWSACIETNTRQTLTLRPSFKSNGKIVIDAFWRPGAQTEKGKLETVILDGGKGVVPKVFDSKWTSISFVRTPPNSSFHLAINLKNGDAGKITFPAEVLQRPVVCRDCKTSDTLHLSAGHYGSGSNPAETLSKKLQSGNYQVTIKSQLQALHDDQGARPVFNFTLVNAKNGQTLASVGQGGGTVFMHDRPYPYTATARFLLPEDATVSGSLHVGQIFGSTGVPNLPSIAFAQSEIAIQKVD